jgi:hypothetical protein
MGPDPLATLGSGLSGRVQSVEEGLDASRDANADERNGGKRQKIPSLKFGMLVQGADLGAHEPSSSGR